MTVKNLVFRNLACVLLATVSLTACGRSVEEASPVGPAPPALSKAAVGADRSRAGVTVIVTNWNPLPDMTGGLGFAFAETGTPMEGVEVSFSRSISGRSRDYAWSGTADEDGIVELEITSESYRGASGYYVAKATDAEGQVLYEWGSIPINAGKEHVISLPVGGGRPKVVSGYGPLDVSLMGSASHPLTDWSIFGSIGVASTIVFHRNVDGDVWGLSMGYNWTRGIGIAGNPPGLAPVEGSEGYEAIETVLNCFDVDVEEGKVWFQVRNERTNPVGPRDGLVTDVLGYFEDRGGDGLDIYNQRFYFDTTGGAIPGWPGFPDFTAECGTRWVQPEQSVAERSNLRIVQH